MPYATTSIVSPLTGRPAVSLVERLRPDVLVEQWMQRFGIDISEEVAGIDEIRRFRCDETGLEFYDPPNAAGSGALYEALQALSWYYMPHKWEYDAALEDVKTGDRILEVGCGTGDFVEWAQEQRDADILGIELNDDAVATAQSLDRPVVGQRLETFSAPEPYDVVCAFQVLEHIRDVAPFLTHCLAQLRDGGRLIVCVPNCAGFIRHASDDLLNQPPHHMSRWTASVFRQLPDYLPVTVRRIAFEPLAAYHLDWYAAIQMERLPVPRGRALRALKRLVGATVLPLSRRLKLHRLLHGHTLYACFEKRAV